MSDVELPVEGPTEEGDSAAPETTAQSGTTPALDSGARKGVFATTSGFPYTYLLTTGLMLAGVAFGSAALSLSIRNRLPSGETS